MADTSPLQGEINRMYMEFTLQIDQRLVDMFRECFEAGMAHQAAKTNDYESEEPDFEDWLSEFVRDNAHG